MKQRIGSINGKAIVYGGNSSTDASHEIRLVDGEGTQQGGGGTNKITIELCCSEIHEVYSPFSIENLKLLHPIKLPPYLDSKMSEKYSNFNIEVIVYIPSTAEYSTKGYKVNTFRFSSCGIDPTLYGYYIDGMCIYSKGTSTDFMIVNFYADFKEEIGGYFSFTNGCISAIDNVPT